MKHTTTQKNYILTHLRMGLKITPIDALESFGCFRLAARIADLRREGHNIRTEMVERNGNRYAEYSLQSPI